MTLYLGIPASIANCEQLSFALPRELIAEIRNAPRTQVPCLMQLVCVQQDGVHMLNEFAESCCS